MFDYSDLAVIYDGFWTGSSSVKVAANVANGTTILIYDDETKARLGFGMVSSGTATITVSPVLASEQRIIAYISAFGNQTYGSIVVVESSTEKTGWKVPETVEGVPYNDYLSAGGSPVPELYTPEECRNVSRDMDAIERVIDLPITFRLRQIESQAGTVQILVEDIQNAWGGYKVKFDNDPEGTTASKIYAVNGTYKLKLWGVNQSINEAITKNYTLVMPTASVTYGTSVKDLFTGLDFGYVGSPGQKAIILVAHSSVACQFKIDGLFEWEGGFWQTGGLAFRSNIKLIPAGEYTIRARNAAVPSEAISRQIKLTGY